MIARNPDTETKADFVTFMHKNYKGKKEKFFPEFLSFLYNPVAFYGEMSASPLKWKAEVFVLVQVFNLIKIMPKFYAQSINRALMPMSADAKCFFAMSNDAGLVHLAAALIAQKESQEENFFKRGLERFSKAKVVEYLNGLQSVHPKLADADFQKLFFK